MIKLHTYVLGTYLERLLCQLCKRSLSPVLFFYENVFASTIGAKLRCNTTYFIYKCRKPARLEITDVGKMCVFRSRKKPSHFLQPQNFSVCVGLTRSSWPVMESFGRHCQSDGAKIVTYSKLTLILRRCFPRRETSRTAALRINEVVIPYRREEGKKKGKDIFQINWSRKRGKKLGSNGEFGSIGIMHSMDILVVLVIRAQSPGQCWGNEWNPGLKKIPSRTAWIWSGGTDDDNNLCLLLSRYP